MNADQLLAEWAIQRWELPQGTEFVSVSFDTYIGCYSDWTHEWGVNAVFTFRGPDGASIVRESEYGLPDIIEQMTEYQEAKDRVEEEHYHYHDYDDEG